MKKKQLLVSIIIPTFNNESTIENCLKSIQLQSYKNKEVLIIDEWSTDKTAQIAKKYKAQVFFHGKERANNRNLGIKKAKGEFIFILDSDMYLGKSVIQDCVTLCQSGYDAVVIPEKSIGKGYWAKVRAFERTFVTGETGDSNVEAARFFKRSLIKKIGGYDPEIVGAEDWDLQQRALQNKAKIGRIKHYIIHEEGYLKLDRLLKKKAYYGKAFLLYKKRYPDAFNKSMIRMSLFRNAHKICMKPSLGFGVFLLKFLEGIALLYGMFLASRGKSFNHY